MSDPRKPIFDAIKNARGGRPFDQMEVGAVDNILDALNVPRAGQAPSTDPIPAGYFDMLARIESGNRPYIKAQTSSASGLFQFTRSTWRGEGGEWGGEVGKFDPVEAAA